MDGEPDEREMDRRREVAFMAFLAFRRAMNGGSAKKDAAYAEEWAKMKSRERAAWSAAADAVRSDVAATMLHAMEGVS